MTRTTLKALWFGGGGILATWLAVSPNQGAPASSAPAAVRRPAAASQPTAEELNLQATRLRQRAAEVELRASTRNPFRFASPKVPERSAPARNQGDERADSSAPLPFPLPAAQEVPMLKLSGMAQQGGKRTAIIVGQGQIYLVGEGESLAGRYTVVAVDAEAIVLRDADGTEQRLLLPR